MAEKPILFSTTMVQAILQGRKTQTRRVIKPQPAEGCRLVEDYPDGSFGFIHGFNQPGMFLDFSKSVMPRWQPGDILWVRETWGIGIQMAGGIIYKADYVDLSKSPLAEGCKWRPSIHMPKNAARIWLEVKSVWPERVQDITEEEAIEEGVAASDTVELGGTQSREWTARENFAELWDEINGKRNGGAYSWDKNPWVWAIEFERIERRNEK